MTMQKERERYVDLSGLSPYYSRLEAERLFYRHFSQIRNKSLVLHIKQSAQTTL